MRNSRPEGKERASQVPAAAVIPAPVTYIEVVAVKTFVVEILAMGLILVD